MTLFIEKDSCSERKYKIELTGKLKKLNETLVIGESTYDRLNSEC